MKNQKKKAVALKYDYGKDYAPMVTAKGKDSLAERIIASAKEHNIPIHEDDNLVEILSSFELYEHIPEELYKAVAEVLTFIYKTTKNHEKQS